MAVKRFPIEASHIMMFARAVADENPIYHDAEYAARSDIGSIIAPPTFAQASAQFDPDYFLRPRPGEPWFGSGREPSSAPRSSGDAGAGGGTGLHAEQHFEYHRPLVPGDVLRTETRPGKSWSKEGRRGGTLQFSESITDYFDESGELVLTARSVGVRTQRVVEQKRED